MKLQKLIIHNIASIEDATIDFEAQPLNESEVFLITGKTGAGKSTILDAICLALFANTPRMKGTEMEGKIIDGNRELTMGDSYQLMRRNTAEASVTLTFTGSNGVHYEATWSVARARKKLTGNLQNKSWQLKNLDTDHTLTKVVDVNQEIRSAIGLDFNQFCRTTLLAQGEFTRFLNSRDDEKAAILEKITGVDIYAKVGKKVYEVTGQKEQAWRAAKQQVEGTRTLTADEIAAKQEEINALDAQYTTMKEAADRDKGKYDWIKTDAELNKAVATATEEHKEAQAVVDSEEYKAKEMTVGQWNMTIDARNWLTAIKGAERSKAELQKALTALESDYVSVLGGYAFAVQEQQQTEADIKVVSALIDREKDKQAVYEQAQTIAGYMTTMAEGRQKMKASLKNIDTENKKLTDKLQPAFDQAQTAVRTAQEAIGKQEEEIKAQEEALAQLNLKVLRQQRDSNKELLQNMATALVLIESLANEKERQQKAAKALEETRSEIDSKQKAVEQMEPLIRDARVKMETCKEMLDKQSDTINKFAKTLRQKLKVGDVCPVCRQQIQSELPHEEELAKLVETLKEAYKEAESSYTKLVDRRNKLDAEITTATKAYAKAKSDFENDHSVETAAQKVAAACKACGMESVDDETPDMLKTLRGKTEDALNELVKKIAEGEGKESAIQVLRGKLDLSRKQMEQLKDDAQKAQQAISDCKGRIATHQELQNAKREEVSKAEQNAEQLIAGQWTIDWKVEPKAFAEMLKKAAADYQTNVRKSQTLATRLSEVSNKVQMVQEVIEDIGQLMPAWIVLKASAVVQQPDILKKANDVKSKTSTVLVQMQQADRTFSDNSRLLESFLDQHTDINRERLTTLNGYTPQHITEMNKMLEADRNKVLTKKTLMEAADRQFDEHKKAKPELQEEDTLETLETCIKEHGKRMAELSEKKGAINQELKADEDRKKGLGQLIEEAEKRYALYQKWSRMSQLIGDATGNKFRKIAQSYVLTSLIHSANSYMKTLTDRYTLKVAPGTFIITLEDAYQGYVSRAASTISGGESFLVSLSLALALSDIGQQLSVDTLFIDEGFGTLSGEPLQNAINTLRSLHNKSGRHVGIISHVKELQEKIPIQIQVIQDEKNSCSMVKVVAQG